MNIPMLLTPKSEVQYIYDTYTIRQALEKMEYHRYSAIPIINNEGQYIGTITEGDLLWGIKNKFGVIDFEKLSGYSIMDIERHSDKQPIGITQDIKDLFERALTQNFVPVIDDSNTFIGIVTRRKIMEFFRTLSDK